jgi:hypothetical protein
VAWGHCFGSHRRPSLRSIGQLRRSAGRTETVMAHGAPAWRSTRDEERIRGGEQGCLASRSLACFAVSQLSNCTRASDGRLGVPKSLGRTRKNRPDDNRRPVAHPDRVSSERTMSNRRTFLKQTAAIGGALGLSPLTKLPLEATVPRTRPSHGRTRAAQHSHPRRHWLHRPGASGPCARARTSRDAVQSRQDAARPLQGKGCRRAHR